MRDLLRPLPRQIAWNALGRLGLSRPASEKHQYKNSPDRGWNRPGTVDTLRHLVAPISAASVSLHSKSFRFAVKLAQKQLPSIPAFISVISVHQFYQWCDWL